MYPVQQQQHVVDVTEQMIESTPQPAVGIIGAHAAASIAQQIHNLSIDG